jgi:hypothetical protein
MVGEGHRPQLVFNEASVVNLRHERQAMNASSVVPLLGGLDLFLLGIYHLSDGMKGPAGDRAGRRHDRRVE